ncbi:general substrate transporter [Nitzschia inconspicua]|uniref:General substrate transporter n=1 Tax=Nitzschia inconspicua TaxID=303405 RepID=A0A9K3Q7R4_9STRA|nr:general substrate transporter [Nitzschia inconspicua]
MEPSEEGTQQPQQLQRPVPHARRTDSSVALSNLPPPPPPPSQSTSMASAPVFDTTTTTTSTTGNGAAPMIDATKFGRSSSARQRSFTARIEGMEKLQTPFAEDNENLTEAEKRMKEEELSFYSASDNDHGDDNIWGLLSGVGGNIYEWYDFAVYGLLAPEIGASFFPQSSKELQLVNSFGVYLAAFVMRPIGAILFGEIGDRMVGRKHALVVSILLITVPSVLMGVLPGYAKWGVLSPVLLVLLRMMQGLSVGGQLAGSYVLSIEQSSSRTRGFRGSVCDASSVGGFLLASLVTSCVRWSLTKDQVDAWGWRLPFLFSLLLAPLLYHVVSHTEESKFWAERSEQKEMQEEIREAEGDSRPAIYDLLSSPFRRRQLVGMIGILSATTSTFYILFLWTPVYLSELRGVVTQAHADSMNFMVVGIYICFLLSCGRLSDTFPHRMDLMRIGLPGIIVACPVMFALFETESWWGYLIGQLLLAACLSMINGGLAAFEVEMWMADPTLSFTGVAVGHNVAATLFGGTMPLMATFLYYKSQELINNAGGVDDFLHSLVPRMLPGFYVSILGLVSLISVSCIVKHPHDVRTGAPKLRAAVEAENRKFRAALDAKKKRRKNMEDQLNNTDGHYLPPQIT